MSRHEGDSVRGNASRARPDGHSLNGSPGLGLAVWERSHTGLLGGPAGR